MTAEELLNPRVKVKGGWPGGNTKTGEIIPVEEDGERLIVKMFALGQFFEMGIHYKNYPHLFEPLPWYAEREISEFPEYLKANGKYTNWYHTFGIPVFKIEGYRKTDLGIFPNKEISHDPIEWFDPATKEEYESFLNTK